MRDPYEVLGIPRTAGDDEVKKAFRKLAKRHHPDRNRDDPRAAERFSELNVANEILGDATKRGQFDRGEIDAEGKPRFSPGAGSGHGGGSGGGFGGARRRAAEPGFEHFEFGMGQGPQRRQAGGAFEGANLFDVLQQATGGGARPRQAEASPDIEVSALVSLEDVARRAAVRVALPGGRSVDVSIPDGVTDGQKVRLRGQGRVFPMSGEAGDVIVTLKFARHPLFRVEKRDLLLDLPLTLDEAVLGGSVRVPTLTGAVDVNIPAGANDGRTLRLRGKGLSAPEGAGDLLVTLRIRLPDADDKLRALAREIRDAGSYTVRGAAFG